MVHGAERAYSSFVKSDQSRFVLPIKELFWHPTQVVSMTLVSMKTKFIFEIGL
jgi:hypothetical protein